MPRVKFFVPFVVGKGRPKFYHGHAVTPKATRDAEARTRRAWLDVAGGQMAPEGVPVMVTVECFSPLPKGRPKRVKSEPYTVRVDADNCGKLILDSLNGVAYADDAQVTELHVYKRPRVRGIEKRTEVTVEWGEE